MQLLMSKTQLEVRPKLAMQVAAFCKTAHDATTPKTIFEYCGSHRPNRIILIVNLVMSLPLVYEIGLY
jgi:hypothetical protein